MTTLPEPGLNWLSDLAERLSPERRATVLELLNLASIALATGAGAVFARVSLCEVSEALARIAGA